jgi:rare lipoprotein A
MFSLFLALLGGCGLTTKTTKTPSEAPKDLDSVQEGEAFQQGTASWYGPKFHGKFTANGEKYDMEAMTAAHKSLPFGSRVRVINLRNGMSTIVRINDRGPFDVNRIIDLSKKAARKINMIGPGTAPVHLYLLEKGSKNKTKKGDLPARKPTYTIQLGAFEDRSSAYHRSSKINGSRVQKIRIQQTTLFRVYFGSYDNWESAAENLEQLKQKGFNGFVKQLDNEKEA